MIKPHCTRMVDVKEATCYLFRSHTGNSAISVSVSEVEQGPDAGRLLIVLEDVRGKVRLISDEIAADLGASP
jgi:hypothetical protein